MTDQGEGVPGPGHPAGPAYAVDIGIRGIGDVVIDNVRDPGNVDTASGDISRHQYPVSTLTKAVQRGLAPRLGEVPLQGSGGVARLGQLFAETPGAVLGPGKDQHRFGVGLPQEIEQQGRLEVGFHRIEGVTDCGRRGRDAYPNRDRVVQDLLGQTPDLTGHGGRKEKRLPLPGKMPEDPPDVRKKSHVEHMVGLVQDQDFEAAEIHGSAADQVEEPAGAGHHDVGTLPEFYLLAANSHAAVYGDATNAGLSAQAPDSLVSLLGQLPCGRDNQPAHAALFSLYQAVQHGKHERRCFAGPGLCQAHNIPAVHDLGNSLCLNRRGINIPLRSHAGSDAGV